MKKFIVFLVIASFIGQVISLIFLFTTDNGDGIINSLWAFLISAFVTAGVLTYDRFKAET